MANKLMTTDEAIKLLKQDIDSLLAEFQTDDERWAVLDSVSRMYGGPGVERPLRRRAALDGEKSAL
jgi:hypothetical protein